MINYYKIPCETNYITEIYEILNIWISENMITIIDRDITNILTYINNPFYYRKEIVKYLVELCGVDKNKCDSLNDTLFMLYFKLLLHQILKQNDITSISIINNIVYKDSYRNELTAYVEDTFLIIKIIEYEKYYEELKYILTDNCITKIFNKNELYIMKSDVIINF